MNKLESTMNKFRKDFCNVMFLLFTMILMTGCSLAHPDGAGEQSKDMLLGVLLTRDEIEKTYAEVVWGEEGIESINFDHLDGPYALCNIWNDEEHGPIYGVVSSDGIDYSNYINVVNSENTYELNVNAYLLKREDTKEQVFFINPIYMASGKNIYVVAGEKKTLDTCFAGDGGTMGYTLNEKETFRWNDTEIESTIKININVSMVDEPQKICFTQMNGKHKVMKRDEFVPGKVPEEVVVEKETKYILVTMKQEGKIKTDRNVCTWDGESTYVSEEIVNKEGKATLYHTFYPDASGFRLKKETWVIWPVDEK